MPEVADMFHPVDCPREYALATRNSNRRNGIPEIESSEQGVQNSSYRIAYQAPTKWTVTSLYENAFLNRSAMDILFSSCFGDDPTRATLWE